MCCKEEITNNKHKGIDNMTKKEFIEKELAWFTAQNPYGDSAELAEHFLNLTYPGDETPSTPGNPSTTDASIENLLKREQLIDILSGALYGSPWFGADYKTEDYLEIKNGVNDEDECFEDKLADLLLAGKKINIYDIEEMEDEDDDEGEWNHWLDLNDIRRGLLIVRDKYPDFYRDLVEEYADLWDYDSVLQCAIFGELTFG